MTQFIAFDPDVEVSGSAILATVAAMGDRVLPILERHDLIPLDPDAWYAQKAWLAAFREIATGEFNATLDLVGIGMRIPENASWPPGVSTIEEAIRSIDQAYHMNHRGGDIGTYRVAHVGDREIEVVCENPYPCDFDYGVLYNVSRMYQPADGSVTVIHDNAGECRKHGGDSCTYIIHW